jgi:hypothetical protein
VQEEGHLDLNGNIQLLGEKLELRIFWTEIKPIVIEANSFPERARALTCARKMSGLESCFVNWRQEQGWTPIVAYRTPAMFINIHPYAGKRQEGKIRKHTEFPRELNCLLTLRQITSRYYHLRAAY